MEHIWLIFFLGFIAWHVLEIRKEISANMGTTTLCVSIDSDETDESGMPKESVCLSRKLNIPFAISLGMELEDVGAPTNFVVERVIFNERARIVHFRPKKVPLAKLETEKKSYIKVGWKNDR